MKKLPLFICLLSFIVIIVSSCGEHEHILVTDAEVPPTCTSEGKTEGVHCSECGEIITPQETVAKTEHSLVVVEAVPPTCTAEGKTEGTYCSECGEVITAQENVVKTEHTPIVSSKRVEATCISEGKTEEMRCSVCGEVTAEITVIPKTEHMAVVDAAKPSTCIETGLSEGSHCSVCGEVLTEQTVTELSDHTVVIDEAVEATCSQLGYTEGSHCSVCMEVFLRQEIIQKLDHTVVSVPGVAATCISEGKSEKKYCSVCGESLAASQTTPKISHNYVGGKCSVCGAAQIKPDGGGEMGLTLENIIAKSSNILTDMEYLGKDAWIDFGNKKVSYNVDTYRGNTDAFGLDCVVYALLNAEGEVGDIFVFFDAEGMQCSAGTFVSKKSARKCAESNANAMIAFINACKNFEGCSYSITAEHSFYGTKNITESQIYELSYMDYPTGEHEIMEYTFTVNGTYIRDGIEWSFTVTSRTESYGKFLYRGRKINFSF